MAFTPPVELTALLGSVSPWMCSNSVAVGPPEARRLRGTRGQCHHPQAATQQGHVRPRPMSTGNGGEWLKHGFYFPRNIGNVIIPIDFHIFGGLVAMDFDVSQKYWVSVIIP